jgi:hypothetical protein
MSIETGFRRGGVVVLLAVSAALPLRAQAVAATRIPKDSIVLRMFARGDSTRAMRVSLDSIFRLMRAIDAEPVSSPASMKLRQQLQALFAGAQGELGQGRIMIATGPDGVRQFGIGAKLRGWIGITTGGVHNEWQDGQFLQYIDYPPIVSVDRQSPAQIAGIVPGDTLIAYDGVDVVAHRINVAQLLTPDKHVAVTVRRDGENKAFNVTVGRASNVTITRRLGPDDALMFPGFEAPLVSAGGGEPPRPTKVVGGGFIGPRVGPGMVMVFPNGVFGASLSNVSAELAKKLNTEPGVLVNEVPEDSPAARMGLKTGDVIVSVAGQPVMRVEDVRMLAQLRGDGRPLSMQVIRDKKAHTIVVK